MLRPIKNEHLSQWSRWESMLRMWEIIAKQSHRLSLWHDVCLAIIYSFTFSSWVISYLSKKYCRFCLAEKRKPTIKLFKFCYIGEQQQFQYIWERVYVLVGLVRCMRERVLVMGWILNGKRWKTFSNVEKNDFDQGTAIG